jgi:hypothetical protein
MGILGPIFEMAAVGQMANAGMSQDNDVFGNLLTHMSDVGNVGVTPPRRGGPGLG